MAAIAIAMPAAPQTTAANSPAVHLADSQATLGSSVHVPAGETRDGDVVALGGSVVVDGTVTQDVAAIGGEVVINGTVGHDVTSVGGRVTLGPHASVGHDIVIVAGSIHRDPQAQIGGQVIYGRPSLLFVAASGSRLAQLSRLSLAFGISIAIAIIIIALVLLAFFPRQLQTTGATVARRPLETLAVGCGGSITGVAVAIVFGITVIGIPMTLAVVATMTAGWLFGWAAIFLLTGQRLLRALHGPQELIPALLTGGLVTGILANIPLFGLIVILVGGSVALGAAIYSRLGTHAPHLPPMTPTGPPAPSPPAA